LILYLHISGQDFIAVNLFANTTGMKLLFDLNVLLRKGNEWDDTNAHQLIKFADKNNFKIAWQLGNGMLSPTPSPAILFYFSLSLTL
jgi:hypothetical protein